MIPANPKFKQITWPDNNMYNNGVGLLVDGTPVIVFLETGRTGPGGKSIDVLTVREIGKVVVHQANS